MKEPKEKIFVNKSELVAVYVPFTMLAAQDLLDWVDVGNAWVNKITLEVVGEVCEEVKAFCEIQRWLNEMKEMKPEYSEICFICDSKYNFDKTLECQQCKKIICQKCINILKTQRFLQFRREVEDCYNVVPFTHVDFVRAAVAQRWDLLVTGYKFADYVCPFCRACCNQIL